MMPLPKLSIIIATKNAKNALLETIDNLHAQEYPALEVIVVDGGSQDGTPEALNAYPSRLLRWSSEPDNGIVDAFNKGLARSTGEYINFQGAGDTLVGTQGLTLLFRQVTAGVEVVCGRVRRMCSEGKISRWVSSRYYRPYWGGEFSSHALLFKMALPHQALFLHRRFFERYGGFDPQWRFAMDYELLLRAYHDFPKTLLSNRIVAHWREGGVGTNRIHEIFDEYHAIKVKHAIAPLPILQMIDRFTRLKYTVKTTLCRGAIK